MKRNITITGLLPVLGLCLSVPATLHSAENLKINPRLNYNSDSQDGPLITGDRMQDGPAKGKPNYIFIYGEG